MDYGAPAWDGVSYKGDSENLSRAKEIALFMMRIMNAPTSSWRNMYIDELGMDVESAQKLPYDEMARRYAHYKYWKDAPLMGWLRGAEDRQAKMDKIRQQFDKAVVDRMQRLDYEELQQLYEDSDDASEKKNVEKAMKAEAKRMDDANLLKTLPSAKSKEERKVIQDEMKSRLTKIPANALKDSIDNPSSLDRKNLFIGEYAKRNGTQDYYGKSNSNQMYQKLRTYADVKEDIRVSDLTSEAKKREDKELLKQVNKLRRKIANQKKALGTSSDEVDEEMMRDIRSWRKEALELLEQAYGK